SDPLHLHRYPGCRWCNITRISLAFPTLRSAQPYRDVVFFSWDYRVARYHHRLWEFPGVDWQSALCHLRAQSWFLCNLETAWWKALARLLAHLYLLLLALYCLSSLADSGQGAATVISLHQRAVGDLLHALAGEFPLAELPGYSLSKGRGAIWNLR